MEKEEDKLKHKHKFVPVGVSWKRYWNYEEKHNFRPKPEAVILACECGMVKLVPAKLQRGTFIPEREKE